MLTSEQKAKRKLGIGGSDAAAVVGICPYRTPLEVYMHKVSDIVNEESNNYLYFGSLLEPIILKEYEKRTGEICLLSTNENKLYLKEYHPIYPWMRANIDGYILEKNIIVECKTANLRTSHLWGEPGTDDIPVNYLLQCAHYAIVYDANRVDLAVLIGGNDFRIYHYHRNEELEKKLIEKEAIFWNENVSKLIPPEPTNLKDNLLLWPISFEKTKTASPETFMHVHQLASLKLRIKELEKEEEDLKLKIQKELQDHDTLLDLNGNKLITWKTQTQKRVDLETFKKNYPHLHAQHLKESSMRTFRLSKLEN